MKGVIKNSCIVILGVVAWFFLCFFGLLPLIEEIYQMYFGADEAYLLTGNLTGVPIVIFLILLGIYLWLFSSNGILGNLWNGEPGWKANFSGRTKGIIFGISILVAMLGIAGSMFWYERFTLDGVESCHFGKKKEYAWEDTEYFTLKAATSDGVLVIELVMKDGERYSFNGGVFRAAEYWNDAYDTQFPEGVYDYAIWLSEELKERNVPLQVKDWDKLKKDLTYDSWDELADQIRAVYDED